MKSDFVLLQLLNTLNSNGWKMINQYKEKGENIRVYESDIDKNDTISLYYDKDFDSVNFIFRSMEYNFNVSYSEDTFFVDLEAVGDHPKYKTPYTKQYSYLGNAPLDENNKVKDREYLEMLQEVFDFPKDKEFDEVNNVCKCYCSLKPNVLTSETLYNDYEEFINL